LHCGEGRRTCFVDFCGPQRKQLKVNVEKKTLFIAAAVKRQETNRKKKKKNHAK